MQPSEDVKPPEGFVKVTKEVFMSTITRRNVHPYPSKFHTEWRQCDSGRVVGFENCGYMNSGKDACGTTEFFMPPGLVPA